MTEWFEENDDVPFMMQVFQIREEKPDKSRLSPMSMGLGVCRTVRKATNPLYHALISAFRELTGVPMVLNTSFNENEPVVCKPEEALDCFLRTRYGYAVYDIVVSPATATVRSAKNPIEKIWAGVGAPRPQPAHPAAACPRTASYK